MKRKTFVSTVSVVTVLVLAAGAGALAQPSKHMKFAGTLNDYTPAVGTGTTSISGPWEVRGHWSMKLKGESGKADFSAELTMERSDQGVILNGKGDFDNSSNSNPTPRNAHTHHITLSDGMVTEIPNGFRVTGTAIITGNGAYPTGNGAYPPPFGEPSSLQIDITGATGMPNEVAFSNIAVTFQGKAANHFGTHPINGVVRNDKGDGDKH
jgi:hypothetical protein